MGESFLILHLIEGLHPIGLVVNLNIEKTNNPQKWDLQNKTEFSKKKKKKETQKATQTSIVIIEMLLKTVLPHLTPIRIAKIKKTSDIAH